MLSIPQNETYVQYSWYWQTTPAKAFKCVLSGISLAVSILSMVIAAKSLSKQYSQTYKCYRIILLVASVLWLLNCLLTFAYSLAKSWLIDPKQPYFKVMNIVCLTILTRIAFQTIVQLMYISVIFIRFRMLKGTVLRYSEKFYNFIFVFTLLIFLAGNLIIIKDPLVVTPYRFHKCPEVDPVCDFIHFELRFYSMFLGTYFCILELALGFIVYLALKSSLPLDFLKTECKNQHKLYKHIVYFVYIWTINNIACFVAFVLASQRLEFPLWSIALLFQTIQFLLCERFSSVIGNLLDLKIMCNTMSIVTQER